MPKQSLIVAAMIDRQQTKIAADTTNRYSVANGVEKLASMICAGPKPPAMAPLQVRDGHQSTEQEHAADDERADDREEHRLGAFRRGSLVSSASVEAVSKP